MADPRLHADPKWHCMRPAHGCLYLALQICVPVYHHSVYFESWRAKPNSHKKFWLLFNQQEASFCILKREDNNISFTLELLAYTIISNSFSQSVKNDQYNCMSNAYFRSCLACYRLLVVKLIYFRVLLNFWC